MSSQPAKRQKTEGETIELKNFIDGSFVTGSSTVDAFDPSTDSVYARVPDSNEEEVDSAVKAAKRAFKSWSKTTPEYRSTLLNEIANQLEARLQEFAAAESRDQGKPIAVAASVDIPRAIHNFRFFAGAILYQTTSAVQQERTGTLNYTIRSPVGVAGLISPWNLPLYLLTWKIAPALAFGNTCVCKPSEFTSLTAFMLCEIFQKVGLPNGVCNMVFGTGPKAGNALVSHPDVPLISFTGGTVTAERIIKSAAPFYKKLSLELGGKNACVIFDDADLDKCVPTAVRSAFSNQGEICLCTSRIFVQKGIEKEFVKRYVEEVKKLKVGNPKEDVNMGPLVSKQHLEKVQSYVTLAKELGGTIETGGKAPSLQGELSKGYFLEPTVITGLPYDATPCVEEIFGPVVTITAFEKEEEVVEWVNCVKYGLAASLWTENVTRMHRVAHEIEAGTIWCNCWMIRDLRMPFGGLKASGIGREGMTHSAEFFTEEKVICLKIH